MKNGFEIIFAYFDPAHVTDELYEREEGNVNIRSVRYEGVLGREGDSDVRKCFCVPKHDCHH